MLADVVRLSDDESDDEPALAERQLADAPESRESGAEICRTRPSRKRKATPEELSLMETDIRRSVRCVVTSNCRCITKAKVRKSGKQSCFFRYRNDNRVLDQITKLRMDIRTMHKADADQAVPLLSTCQLYVFFNIVDNIPCNSILAIISVGGLFLSSSFPIQGPMFLFFNTTSTSGSLSHQLPSASLRSSTLCFAIKRWQVEFQVRLDRSWEKTR